MEDKKIYRKQEYVIGHGSTFVSYDKGKDGTQCPVFSTKTVVKPNIQIKRCREGVILPEKTKGNAGIDLRVLTEHGIPVMLAPNETKKFYTGIKMNIPEGYYIEVVPRSSTGIKKCLRLMNTCGILDSSWKGETIVALHNFGTEPVLIENNDRICQMILHEDIDVHIEEVDDVGTSKRGENGIGSTGDK